MANIEGENVPSMGVLALDPSLIEGETCGWPIIYADCGGDCEAYAKWPEAERETAQLLFETQAIDLLYNWTGRVFGICETVIRPCRDDCGGGRSADSTFWGRGPGFDPGFPRRGMGGLGGWRPVLVGGEWLNIGCGCLSACDCGIDGSKALTLPGPIQSVTQIRIDGVVLPPTAYRVDHNRLLVRIDGQSWPACQDLLAEPDQENTFEITYMKGVRVPLGGQVAAGRLACELALGACGDDECQLPERLQTVTRQGITVGISLSAETWTDTNIWSIDGWVKSMKKRERPTVSVRSPDTAPGFPGYRRR